MSTAKRTVARFRRKKHVRKHVSGSENQPRLTVFRSSKHIYAQIIDDVSGRTLAAASSLTAVCKSDFQKDDNKKAIAKKVGAHLATLAKEAGVATVKFDRNGFRYHGRVASLADGAREGGLVF